MGVHGLWQVIDAAGQPVTLESLEGQRLAIDISLWLHQAVRGAASHQPGTPNPHLVTLMHRIVKLLFYRIRPVFVFDGQAVPQFKQRVLTDRRMRRDQAHIRLTKALKARLLRKAAEATLTDDKALDLHAEELSKIAAILSNTERSDKALFNIDSKLEPEKLRPSSSDDEDSDWSDDETKAADWLGDTANASFTSTDSADADTYTRLTDDLNTAEFDQLPVDARRDLLLDRQVRLRETRLRRHQMPDEAGNFSRFQLDRLQVRGQVVRKLNEVGAEFNELMAQNALGHGHTAKTLAGRNVQISATVVHEGRKRQHVLLRDHEPNSVQEDEPSADVSPSKRKPDVQSTTSCISSHLDFLKQQSGLTAAKLATELEEDSDSDNASSVPEPDQQLDGVSAIIKPEPVHYPTLLETVGGQKVVVEQTHDKSTPERDSVSDLRKVVFEQTHDNSDAHSRDRNGDEPKQCVPESPVEVKTSKSEPVTVGNGVSSSVRDTTTNIETESQQDELPCCSKSLPIEVPDRKLSTCLDADLLTESIDKSSASGSDDDDLIDVPNADLVHLTLLKPINVADDAAALNEEVVGSEKRVEQPLSTSTILPEESSTTQDASTAKSITAQMYEDCQQLLCLFGLPFLVAPGEAEAQCAALETLGLVSGTMSDDSDVWLFGAQTVYRHVFNKSQHVHRYTVDAIVSKCGLSRQLMILLAMLAGCDYTDGIQGVGYVTALEIIAEFMVAPENDEFADPVQTLINFRRWLQQCQQHDSITPPSPSARRNRLARQANKWVMPDSFPDSAVFQAYWKPAVDHSTEPFTWSSSVTDGITPAELSALQDFAFSRMSWSEQHTRDVLKPLLDRYTEHEQRCKSATGGKSGAVGSFQTHITSFARFNSMNVFGEQTGDPMLTKSKRVVDALKAIKARSGQCVQIPAPATSTNSTKSIDDTDTNASKRPNPTISKKTTTRRKPKPKPGRKQPKVTHVETKQLPSKRAASVKANQRFVNLSESDSD